MEIFIRGLVALGIALAVATIGFSDTVAPQADNGYGWSPCMKALFGKGIGHRCGGGCGGGCGAKGAAPQAPAHHPPLRSQPGTVVFPQHPFVRSPRDFFMMD